MRTHRPTRRSLALAVVTGLMALPLAACGPFGGGAPEPVASIDAVKGRSTAIKLDAGFAAALEQLGLTPGTVGKGRLQKGSLVFPITGGNVTVFEPGEVSPYVIGQLQHDTSGFSLAAGGTTVAITDLNVDPGVSRVYGDVSVNGKRAATNAFLFQLDGRTLKPLKTERGLAILTGTEVKVSRVAARLLNQTFDTKAVKPGLLVGVATIRVRLP